jgi:uncharacterized membrane protein
MNRKTAALSFLAICLVLVILLLAKTITALVGGIIFALALALFGVISRGFTRDSATSQ